MINYLKIKNFSLVKDLEIKFDSKLNVIYGESGSGKSLILKTISILTGDLNGSFLFVREGEEKAVLEIEIETIGIIQKIISKSRSIQSIDGEIVTLTVLKEKLNGLVENFSQGEQEEIYTRDYQNNFINNFFPDDLEKVKKSFLNWKEISDKFNRLKSEIQLNKEKKEFYEFQLKEIDFLNLYENEDKDLEVKIQQYSNKEIILESLKNMSEYLIEMKELESKLGVTQENLKNKYKFDFSSFYGNNSDTYFHLTEGFTEIENYLNQYESDKEVSLDSLNSRLYEIQKLKKRFGKQNVNELITYGLKLKEDLFNIDNEDESLSFVESKEKELFELYKIDSNNFHLHQKKQIQIVVEQLKELLPTFGFDFVDIQTKWIDLKEPCVVGLKVFEFLISFNKGFEPKEMRKIVSGGEASRLALAFKILSRNNTTKIMILDEIDTGLSGKALENIGDVLTKINCQTICVTHSKEIINRGNKKIKVYKKEISNKTETKTEIE